jgi:hypothetical protein
MRLRQKIMSLRIYSKTLSQKERREKARKGVKRKRKE